MNSDFKLLIVEDDDDTLKIYDDTIKVYCRKNKQNIKHKNVKTVNDATSVLNQSWDGVIIDLKLAAGEKEGNEVIEKIHSDYRIPVAVLTGTPADVADLKAYIGVYKKGEAELPEILDKFFQIYNTGLTRILGNRGDLEKRMNIIFWQNIFPQMESWVNYAKEKNVNTEPALLRYIINHLAEDIDNSDTLYFPEEMYIKPPLDTNYKTGSVLKKNSDNKYYVILSPACDMALRNEQKPKTDQILICKIEKKDLYPVAKLKKEINDSDLKKVNEAKNTLIRMLNNSYAHYYHYLPQTGQFTGGFINFRRINTYTLSELKGEFRAPELQLTAPFIKDIVSRFASYYARQGQPDFDKDRLFRQLTD